MKEQKFLDSTIRLFEDYRNKMKNKKPKSYNLNLSNEIHLRLWQLSFICDKILHYEKIVTKPTSSIEDRRKCTRFFDEGIVFAEAFYFFAWRIMTITDHYTNPLPGLKGLKGRAKGVVIVRNCLIEHPERPEEKIFMISYGWDSNGPKLKNVRPVGQSFEISDNGFWKNAKEFKDGLEKLLQSALAA